MIGNTDSRAFKNRESEINSINNEMLVTFTPRKLATWIVIDIVILIFSFISIENDLIFIGSIWIVFAIIITIYCSAGAINLKESGKNKSRAELAELKGRGKKKTEELNRLKKQ